MENTFRVLRHEARTWLMAGPGGQCRHDSRRLLPGSLLAVENGSAASEGVSSLTEIPRNWQNLRMGLMPWSPAREQDFRAYLSSNSMAIHCACVL